MFSQSPPPQAPHTPWGSWCCCVWGRWWTSPLVSWSWLLVSSSLSPSWPPCPCCSLLGTQGGGTLESGASWRLSEQSGVPGDLIRMSKNVSIKCDLCHKCAFFPGDVFMIIVKKCARIGSPEEIVTDKSTVLKMIITWAKWLWFAGTWSSKYHELLCS